MRVAASESWNCVEVISKAGGVGSIAWLGITLDSERMDSLLFLLAKYGLIAEGLKVHLASQAFARGCGVFDELADGGCNLGSQFGPETRHSRVAQHRAPVVSEPSRRVWGKQALLDLKQDRLQHAKVGSKH